MGVGQTNLTGRRGPLATPQGIIRWRVSGTKYVRQKYVTQRESFPKFAGRMRQGRRRAAHPKNKFRKLKFQAGTGGTLAYNAGDETAGPRKSNPEPVERIYL
jgi:hypothetical protein